MKNPFTPDELARFTGSEERYRHAVNRNVLFTEGVMYLADRTGAYWLLDEIALTQHYDGCVYGESFQIWTLQVNADCTGRLVCDAGDGDVLYSRGIPLADFPGQGITLWFTDGTILLPSEYLSCAKRERSAA